VVVAEVVGPYRLDGGLDADGQAPAQGGLGGEALEDLILHALLGARPRALLFEDDLPLAVDLGGQEGHGEGDIGNVGQSLFHALAAAAGKGKLVGRLVEAREGILVTAEGETERLEEGNHRPRGEVGGAVERHVLEVVGEPARGLCLVEGAAGNVEPDGYA